MGAPVLMASRPRDEGKSRGGGSGKGQHRQKPVSWQELASHNTPGDLWVAISGVAYDVSGWTASHPGGAIVLEATAGRDATEPFHAYHPDWVKARLEGFRIGEMETVRRGGNLPPPGTVAYWSLKARIEEMGMFETRLGFYVKVAVWLLALFAASWALVASGRWALGALVVALFWQQAAFVGHDAGHNAITHDRKKDAYIMLLINASIGVGMSWWKSSHNVHHTVVNSLECDPDIQHLPLIAVSPGYFQSLHSEYHDRKMVYDSFAKLMIPIQHIAFIPVLAIAKFGLYAQTALHFLKGRKAYFSFGPEVASLSIFWCWYFIMIMLIPSWPERIMFFALSHASFFILHLQICLSHFSRHTFHGLPQDDDWFVTQTAGTLNYKCPPWLDWFHGGLHFQIEHHLFPRVPRHNLRKLSTLVEPLCAELGIEYISLGFFEAVGKTFKCLKTTADKAHMLDLMVHI